jgi:copper chaperone CopZ
MTQQETLLKVDGMSCRSCVHHVDVALKDVDGVSKVDVRLREGQVLVHHDAATPVERLVKALADAGYESAPLAA